VEILRTRICGRFTDAAEREAKNQRIPEREKRGAELSHLECPLHATEGSRSARIFCFLGLSVNYTKENDMCKPDAVTCDYLCVPLFPLCLVPSRKFPQPRVL